MNITHQLKPENSFSNAKIFLAEFDEKKNEYSLITLIVISYVKESAILNKN